MSKLEKLAKENRRNCNLIISKVLIFLTILSVFVIIIYFCFWNPEDTFEECKINTWKGCGLKVTEDMCFRIEGKNTTKWINCQNITTEQAECWNEGFDLCYQRYIMNTTDK